MRPPAGTDLYTLLLCFLIGSGLGYCTRAPAPDPAITGGRETPAAAAAPQPTTSHREITRPQLPLPAPVAAPPPAAGFPPLPPPGPIRGYLDALRERARLGDRAAARRAHRDLHYCAVAPLRSTRADESARVGCIIERLCADLGPDELDEAGDFLMRAAELGDVDAMAAVADGLVLDDTLRGMRRLSTVRALGAAYQRRALEAGSPVAMFNMVFALCAKDDPLTSPPFRRDLPAEERLAWFHAIRPMLAGTQLAETDRHCAANWSPEIRARAEARGRALHAQHYAGHPERSAPLLPRLRQARADLGQQDRPEEDPRLQEWPECAG